MSSSIGEFWPTKWLLRGGVHVLELAAAVEELALGLEAAGPNVVAAAGITPGPPNAGASNCGAASVGDLLECRGRSTA